MKGLSGKTFFICVISIVSSILRRMYAVLVESYRQEAKLFRVFYCQAKIVSLFAFNTSRESLKMSFASS